MLDRSERRAALEAALKERILIMDGAMGTMIQTHKLGEAEYRGERFATYNHDVKGDNDLLNLTQPHIIEGIHSAYFEASADFATTNTFNSTTVAQSDYSLEHIARELNVEGARIARRTADAWTEKTPDRPRFVAGSIGPLNRTASVSPDVNDPGYRNITFDELRQTYREAVEGLIEGGVDTLLLETIFDTLNAKGALFAIAEVFEEQGFTLPVMVSGTVTDMSGRNLSGQNSEALWISVRHANPLTIGLNCAFGAELLRPHLAELSRVANTYICAYPNAGLPNEFGEYDEPPETTASLIREWAESSLINIVGGCCGTTPNHIRAIAEAVAGFAPRPIPASQPTLRLSGLEPFTLA